MPWYTGKTVLEHLESIDNSAIYNEGTPRFPVQNVIRPKTDSFHDFPHVVHLCRKYKISEWNIEIYSGRQASQTCHFHFGPSGLAFSSAH